MGYNHHGNFAHILKWDITFGGNIHRYAACCLWFFNVCWPLLTYRWNCTPKHGPRKVAWSAKSTDDDLLVGKNSVSGWWFEPLWKILVNWDDYSQYMGTQKMFQTTNQICLLEKIVVQTFFSVLRKSMFWGYKSVTFWEPLCQIQKLDSAMGQLCLIWTMHHFIKTIPSPLEAIMKPCNIIKSMKKRCSSFPITIPKWTSSSEIALHPSNFQSKGLDMIGHSVYWHFMEEKN